jgi:uncharacterized iron-regulated membrane protein
MTLPERTSSGIFLSDLCTIWRWHFYAGLFCIPFVLWLSVTGTNYPFKPQVEAWLDSVSDGLLSQSGLQARPEMQVQAALEAVRGSNLYMYEMPGHPGSAPQIIVGKECVITILTGLVLWWPRVHSMRGPAAQVVT